MPFLAHDRQAYSLQNMSGLHPNLGILMGSGRLLQKGNRFGSKFNKLGPGRFHHFGMVVG